MVLEALESVLPSNQHQIISFQSSLSQPFYRIKTKITKSYVLFKPFENLFKVGSHLKRSTKVSEVKLFKQKKRKLELNSSARRNDYCIHLPGYIGTVKVSENLHNKDKKNKNTALYRVLFIGYPHINPYL